MSNPRLLLGLAGVQFVLFPIPIVTLFKNAGAAGIGLSAFLDLAGQRTASAATPRVEIDRGVAVGVASDVVDLLVRLAGAVHPALDDLRALELGPGTPRPAGVHRGGPTAVHRFLGEVFRLASDPIEEHGGEVYQYVGDEMLITWTVAAGRARARPVASFFAVERALARSGPRFEHEFGAVPRLRAALHAGPVITGEVGGSRRAIVYHGDVMNTTARIEQATRDLDRQFLASSDALVRLANHDGFALEDLGLQQLRGRDAPMRVYAITPPASLDGHTTALAEPGLSNRLQPSAPADAGARRPGG